MDRRRKARGTLQDPAAGLNYVSNPTALLYDLHEQDEHGAPVALAQLLYGDAVEVIGKLDDHTMRVRARLGEGRKKVEGRMVDADIGPEPMLEITFVDIGQGDGCLLITPDGRHVVLDAGKGDNMKRFLRYRLGFPSVDRPVRLHAAVISHGDDDHYRGFEHVFAMSGVTFENLYQNGLVERKGKDSLGPKTKGSPGLYTGLVKSTAQLRRVLDKEAKIKGRKVYADMLRKALDAGKFSRFRMLSRDDQHMPGFGPGSDVVIEVLGPIIEQDEDAKRGLRSFGPASKTKNGHSVILRLTYGNVKVMLGGDLNEDAQRLLLETTVGRKLPELRRRPKPTRAEKDELSKKRARFMEEARSHLQVDVAKSCHHGSADFSSLFIEALSPVATVISSGDDEGYSHPRAETLGTIGARSRGERPLIFSTELARSVRDAIRDPREERREILAAHERVLEETDEAKRRKLQSVFKKKIDALFKRSVQTHGAIYFRSNGERVVIAQKYERNRPCEQYDVYVLDPNEAGELVFESEDAPDYDQIS